MFLNLTYIEIKINIGYREKHRVRATYNLKFCAAITLNPFLFFVTLIKPTKL